MKEMVFSKQITELQKISKRCNPHGNINSIKVAVFCPVICLEYFKQKKFKRKTRNAPVLGWQLPHALHGECR